MLTQEEKEFWKENECKNFPIECNGKIVWRSRSVAVVGFIYYEDGDKVFILANKRGSGTPDFQHCWNVTCGYLDYNEDGQQGTARELYEEVGFIIDPKLLKLLYVNSDPQDSNRQNISLRHGCILSKEEALAIRFTTEKSEENEVEGIKWISLDELDNYQWAFNQRKLIEPMYEKLKERTIVIKHKMTIEDLQKLQSELTSALAEVNSKIDLYNKCIQSNIEFPS